MYIHKQFLEKETKGNNMNINFNSQITNIFGGRMVGADDEPIRLGSLCVNALMGVFKDEEGLTGEEKIRRTLLAEKLIKKSKGEVITFATTSIDAEDVVLIKKLANKMFPSPTLYTPIVRMLEGKTESKKVNDNNKHVKADVDDQDEEDSSSDEE